MEFNQVGCSGQVLVKRSARVSWYAGMGLRGGAVAMTQLNDVECHESSLQLEFSVL